MRQDRNGNRAPRGAIPVSMLPGGGSSSTASRNELDQSVSTGSTRSTVTAPARVTTPEYYQGQPNANDNRFYTNLSRSSQSGTLNAGYMFGPIHSSQFHPQNNQPAPPSMLPVRNQSYGPPGGLNNVQYPLQFSNQSYSGLSTHAPYFDSGFQMNPVSSQNSFGFKTSTPPPPAPMKKASTPPRPLPALAPPPGSTPHVTKPDVARGVKTGRVQKAPPKKPPKTRQNPKWTVWEVVIAKNTMQTDTEGRLAKLRKASQFKHYKIDSPLYSAANLYMAMQAGHLKNFYGVEWAVFKQAIDGGASKPEEYIEVHKAMGDIQAKRLGPQSGSTRRV